jgi:muramoyltetrapeptide carboxypeptidase
MSTRKDFLLKAGALGITSLIPTNTFGKYDFEVKTKLKPARLKSGDTVAIISPAGAVWDTERIDFFANILKNFGFNVVLGKTLTEKWGYFSGKDELRAQELNEMFADKNVKGIFCMKGGWGCARIIDKLDYELIKKNPKVLIGFSDITALLLAIQHKTGLITFHGPVGNSGWNDYTTNVFKKVLMDPESGFGFPQDQEGVVTIHPGIAEGEFAGGNLTVLSSLIGTGYLPNWKGKILFLEEVKEEPYSIDRMMTQLKLSGVMNDISGLVFGQCAKCLAEEPEKAFTFDQVIRQHLEPLKIPSFYGANIGHIENKLTIPLGIKGKVNSFTTPSIDLLEAAVL